MVHKCSENQAQTGGNLRSQGMLLRVLTGKPGGKRNLPCLHGTDGFEG
jgi:hypothetical protein